MGSQNSERRGSTPNWNLRGGRLLASAPSLICRSRVFKAAAPGDASAATFWRPTTISLEKYEAFANAAFGAHLVRRTPRQAAFAAGRRSPSSAALSITGLVIRVFPRVDVTATTCVICVSPVCVCVRSPAR